MACKHDKDWDAQVDVRIIDGTTVVVVAVQCYQCEVPYRFIGANIQRDDEIERPGGPVVDERQLVLVAPIEPASVDYQGARLVYPRPGDLV